MSTTLSRQHSVYVTRNVPESGIQLLTSAGLKVTQWKHDAAVPREELLTNISQVDALFCLLTDKVDSELLDAAGGSLKVIGTMSVGHDHIDMEECKKRGIRVGFTPDVLTHATAELTVALLLATSRRLMEGVQAAKDGSWGTWKPTWLCGPSLQNSTVGILGFGRIGQQVAKNLGGFDVGKIIYTARTEVASCAQRVEFDELLLQSDFLIICCALTDSTKNLFDKNAFLKMKKSAILVNTSRGPVVNMDDLAEALENKEIAGAGLDVTVPEPIPLDHSLLKLNNCVVLPHIGSATNEARSAMSRLTAENIIAALNNQKMPAEL